MLHWGWGSQPSVMLTERRLFTVLHFNNRMRRTQGPKQAKRHSLSRSKSQELLIWGPKSAIPTDCKAKVTNTVNNRKMRPQLPYEPTCSWNRFNWSCLFHLYIVHSTSSYALTLSKSCISRLVHQTVSQGSHTSQMRKLKGISRVIKGSTAHFHGYFGKLLQLCYT